LSMSRIRAIGYRPTWAEINLRSLGYNFGQVKKLIPPRTKILVSVKADAYGHGLIPVARRLVRCKVDYLGVASIDEGIALRKAGIRVPILVLGVILKGDIEPVLRYGLTSTVCDEVFARALNAKALKHGLHVKAHLKVDTGMHRIGVACEDAFTFMQKMRGLRGIYLEGMFTHFPLGDTDREFTLRQVKSLILLKEKLAQCGMAVPLVHAANSIGVLSYAQGHLDMVRPGLVIYGLHPVKNPAIRFKPVLSLKTRVVFSKKLPRGSGISYGHAYVTEKPTTVVTLPIGYGDGYPRNLSNLAPVLIQGRRYTVSGRICMDQMMVDVRGAKVAVGEEAVLIGRQKKGIIFTEELAELCNTIPYEIVCGLGSRIPRVYIT
jgi:alanine racemase